MTLHLPAIPGRWDDPCCAYTSKSRRFARMMDGVVIHPTDAPDLPPEGDAAWGPINAAQAESINAAAEPGDVLCIPYGVCQRQIAEAVDLPAVEYGIGYSGTFAQHRVFESYAWMHTVLGSQQGGHTANGSPTDAVIPNFFDPAEFPEGKGDGGYLLYVGRLIDRKGVEWACEAARRAGKPLLLAGEGPHEPSYGTKVGVVGPEDRAELMGGAEALLCPTQYIEPFGGVAVEAMLCGTPALTTDWGAFTETVEPGLSGYRCRDVEDLVIAIGRVPALDRELVRWHALNRFTLDVIRPRYESYFATVRGGTRAAA